MVKLLSWWPWCITFGIMLYVQIRYHDIVGTYLTLIFAGAIMLTLDAIILTVVFESMVQFIIK